MALRTYGGSLMEDFNVHVLGTASAIPAYDRHLSAQLVHYHKNYLLIDCGEGTQIPLVRQKHKFLKISHILISHLHGDHYLGLPGLLSTMSLFKRTSPLHIFAPGGLAEIITVNFKHSAVVLSFPVHFHPLPNINQPTQLFETELIKVSCFPLAHRIPCYGFLVQEQPRERSIIPEKLPSGLPYQLIKALKKGETVSFEGNLLSPEFHTLPPRPPRSYAYCSDTLYLEHLAQWIKNVNLLYHEATFMEKHATKAKATCHSTTTEAATLALKANVDRLLIGHFSMRYTSLKPLLDEAREIFPETYLAEEKLRMPI